MGRESKGCEGNEGKFSEIRGEVIGDIMKAAN